MQEKFHNKISLIKDFCKLEDASNLIVCTKSSEESDFVEEFFHRNQSLVITDKEIYENIIFNDINGYIESMVTNCDKNIVVLKNVDSLLETEQKNKYSIFLKQFIDEIQDYGCRIVLIVQNENVFSILPDLFSRIKSFHRILFYV